MASVDSNTQMIPAGYLAKRIAQCPAWLEPSRVQDVYSVSDHISPAFADYIGFWKHNGFWIFDSPDLIRRIAEEHSIDLSGTRFFYYEVYAWEYDQEAERWSALGPGAFETRIVTPAAKRLEGFDIVTFSAGAGPECSPLSCNQLANSIHTNEHCLLASVEEACRLLEQGVFKRSEPGPYRIWAVYSVGA